MLDVIRLFEILKEISTTIKRDRDEENSSWNDCSRWIFLSKKSKFKPRKLKDK